MPDKTPKFEEVAGDLKRRGEDAMQSFGRAALETGRGPMATLAGVALLGFAAGVAASLSKRAATEVAIGAVEDWVEALAAEHRNIEGLFEQILSAGETETLKRAKLFRRLDRVMSRHAFAEEQVVYTTLGQHEADAEARQLSADHFDHRAMLHAIDALDRNDPSWREAVRRLYKSFAGHAHHEDHDIYPALRARLSPEENARLHRDLAKRSARLA